MALSPWTITLSFGDRAESHAGMVRHGALQQDFSADEMDGMLQRCQALGAKAEMLDIGRLLDFPQLQGARVLIIPDGVRAITEAQVDAKALGMALKSLQWDSTALMWGKVRQKKARHNLVFGTAPSKAASIAEGRGTRVCFADVPGLPALHSCLERFCTRGLEGEGNFYYDVNKCGIGFHCDSERTFTLACRFGSTMNIKWAAFNGAAYLEKMLERELPEGCIYVMNKLAAGRSTRGFHLRHAAGAECYAKIARKNVPGLRAQRKRRRGEADEERDDEA